MVWAHRSLWDPLAAVSSGSYVTAWLQERVDTQYIPVALKMYQVNTRGKSKAELQGELSAVMHEVLILQGLAEHPNIVTCLGCFSEEGASSDGEGSLASYINSYEPKKKIGVVIV